MTEEELERERCVDDDYNVINHYYRAKYMHPNIPFCLGFLVVFIVGNNDFVCGLGHSSTQEFYCITEIVSSNNLICLFLTNHLVSQCIDKLDSTQIHRCPHFHPAERMECSGDSI